VTERPEAVDAGTVQLVGTDAGRIVAAVDRLYDDDSEHGRFARRANPYGDGRAAQRIVSALSGLPFEEFAPALRELAA
jgi:UDP-N-acetylglucosamine 2-epimerase (non-hydrolysing)